MLLEIPPALDQGILRRALQHLQAHHDALRMRYRREGLAWTQACAASLDEVALESFDLGSMSPDEQRAAMTQAADRLQSTLDISAGPLMRVATFRFGEEEPGRLLWVIHHLLVDAVSWQILLSDLGMAYHQLLSGQAVKLPPKTTSFKRWVERLLEVAGSEAFDDERAITAMDPEARLPVDRPGGRNGKESLVMVRAQLSEPETRSLLGDALKPYRMTVQELLLTALAQSVARWTGTNDVWLDLEGHGREDLGDDIDLSRTIGWFTSLFPVRLSLPGVEGDPAEALTAVKEQFRAIPRRGLGYGLLRYLHADGEALRWPRPELSFNYLGRMSYVGRAGGDIDSPLNLRFARESVGPLDSPEGERSHVLQINCLVDDDRLDFVFGYSADLHEAATVERLAADFIAALKHLILHCLSPAAGGWSPSDFPLAGLNGAELRGLLGRMGERGRSGIAAIYPMTSVQRDMLSRTLESGTPSMYMTQAVLNFEGELDVAALRSAWARTVHAHPLLRSCFAWEGLTRPVQVVLRAGELPWDEHDLRDAPDRGARLAAMGEQLTARGLPLDAAPLGRLTLVRTANRSHTLFYDCHHVLTDGWSLGVILGEVFDAYRAAKNGKEPRAISTGSY
ncbi:MAG: condensation domain-containing protein, partial [Byssovorax sp.]